MRSILFPTDFSEYSRRALDYATTLTDKLNAKIKLFHAYHIPYIHAEMPAGMYQKAIEDAEDEAKKELDKLEEEIRKKTNNKVECEVQIKLGFAVEEILKTAEEDEIDLIALGTKGEGGVADVIFGSIAENVISKAECPVLAIPENSRFTDSNNIAFATNYDESDIVGLQKLIDFASHFDANIFILHVNKTGEEIDKNQEDSYKEHLQQKLDYSKISFHVYEADDVSEGLNQYIETHEIDLVAVFKKKRSLFKNLFHSSITKKLAFHSSIPILAFHE